MFFLIIFVGFFRSVVSYSNNNRWLVLSNFEVNGDLVQVEEDVKVQMNQLKYLILVPPLAISRDL